MKKVNIVDAGHTYDLHNFQEKGSDSDVGVQTLHFIKKEPVEEGSTEMKTVHEGTTNEAVIEMLIDRLRFLDEKMPSEYNQKAISDLESAWEALNQRTAERVERDVEGKHEA
jgi:hypothetical protein